jgi:hypothetical protein
VYHIQVEIAKIIMEYDVHIYPVVGKTYISWTMTFMTSCNENSSAAVDEKQQGRRGVQ